MSSARRPLSNSINSLEIGMATTITARSSALGFASLGYGVFPLHSVTKRGNKLACTCGDSNCTNQGKHPSAASPLMD